MRISTTTLESFRLFMTEDWMAEADLINSIKGVRVETDAMRLGTAFHRILETPEPHRTVCGYFADGFHFPDATMQPALDLIDRRGVFEVKSTKPYGAHTVVCKADQLVGCDGFEHKTTCSSFDADKYLASYQWRFEMAIFGPELVRLTYRVFCLEEPKEGIVGLRGIEVVPVYRYPQLETDCADLVRRFADYVTARGLTQFLQPKLVQDVAA
jgi:hypothetical protein